MRVMKTYHDREGDFELINSLKHTEHNEESKLDDSVDMDAIVGDPSEVLAVRATLTWNEEQLEALNELNAIERGHTHIK